MKTQNRLMREITSAFPLLDSVRGPDERGVIAFRWRVHEFRVHADGYVEEVGDGRNDLCALVERLLEVVPV